MLDDDETVINEMQNSMKSRNILRAKHMAQLEEKKAGLQGLKAKVSQQFLPASSIELDKLINKINNNDFNESKHLKFFFKQNLALELSIIRRIIELSKC